ncbi:30S ribosomal protein S18 [Candidatus Gottesmanbacteria bacterium]|nr:30S ribosomal protein S18 [Candidatus Gottesmanbacteria bacterium]
MMKRSNRFQRRERPVPRNCGFCKNKIEPDYKEITALQRFTTERGKLLGRARSGICSKHQRALTREVKRARFMALLPFVVRA